MKHFSAVAAMLSGLLLPVLSQASSYPDKPVRLVVGFSPGGPTDVVARVIAEGLSAELKQTMVVENKPGAGGTIAAAEVAKARPDGYTALISGVNHSINPAMYDKLGFDSANDFEPAASVALAPSVLVVRPDFPAANYKEFIALVSKAPGKYTVAAAGGSKFTAELFMHETKSDLVVVMYKGAAPAMTDVMGGHADMSFATLGSVLPQLQSGKMRAIAVAAEVRVDGLPDTPTFKEVGLPGFRLDAWTGLLFPKGTPAEIVRTMRDALVKLAAQPAFRERIAAYGMTPILDQESAAFKQQIKDEIKLYLSLGKDIGSEKVN